MGSERPDVVIAACPPELFVAKARRRRRRVAEPVHLVPLRVEDIEPVDHAIGSSDEGDVATERADDNRERVQGLPEVAAGRSWLPSPSG